MGYGVNKLIFGITGTEEPRLFESVSQLEELLNKLLNEGGLIISKPKSFSQREIFTEC